MTDPATGTHRHDLLGTFAQHKVAANLLMIMLLLLGALSLTKLNTQFFPNFNLDYVQVKVLWSGAATEDIERGITQPLENRLRFLDGVKEMISTSTDGVAVVVLEYEDGSDMVKALEKVKEQVALVRGLPSAAETPEVVHLVRYDPIARVLLSTQGSFDELRYWVRRFERQLREQGISKINLTGLPQEEVAIQLNAQQLQGLGLSLTDISDRVSAMSQNIPAGPIGQQEVSRQLRSLGEAREVSAFEELALAGQAGSQIRLGDVATIQQQSRRSQSRVYFKGEPAVELRLLRGEDDDALQSAEVLNQWLITARAELPPGLSLHVYDESWKLIKERILLLLKNGGGGLLLVVLILFLFLNGRVAFWVAVGIPTSFMAALAVLYWVGGSINMISLFALIMALGIIVDDAIVVGEDAMAHYQRGEHPLQAAEGGARRMLAPVLSSSLTTIAAFLPLMMIGGIIGNILFDIPLIIVCVIVASLIESFLVLPGHLKHAFVNLHHQRSAVRQWLDNGFAAFRDRVFRPWVTLAVRFRGVTLALSMASLILCIGLLAGGRIGFHFFPTPEGATLYANVQFVTSSNSQQVNDFLSHLEDALEETNAAFGGDLLVALERRQGLMGLAAGGTLQRGDHVGSLIVELTQPDTREVTGKVFMAEWKKRVEPVAGLENLALFMRVGGPPGRDIEVRLFADDVHLAKKAALELATAVGSIAGVSAVEDDMPYGQTQMLFSLTREGVAQGLTTQSLGRQLRVAYEGEVVQIFHQGDEEIEVRVMLDHHARAALSSLDNFPIRLPNGQFRALPDMASISWRRGFAAVRHAQGKRAVLVSADLDHAVNKVDQVNAQLEAGVLSRLEKEYGVHYQFEGKTSDQRETMADMRRGTVVAFILIYLILAWVFASYGWPLVVMAAIPFGLVGAIGGHWLMNIDLTILSLFGVFGLSGIVVNDSIILVVFFKQLRNTMATQEAIIEAACQRLRAVLLTSLTTIAGLLPLLFETSLQAQFLIPMAVSIAFGLAFATFLVLFFIPALLSVYESVFSPEERA